MTALISYSVGKVPFLVPKNRTNVQKCNRTGPKNARKSKSVLFDIASLGARCEMCIVKGMQGLLYNCFVCIVQGVHLQVYCRKYLMCIIQGVQCAFYINIYILIFFLIFNWTPQKCLSQRLHVIGSRLSPSVGGYKGILLCSS